MNEEDQIVILKRGAVLYSICFQGDWERSTFFLKRSDALLAILDSIFIRDTVGMATKEFPSKHSRSSNHRFESMVQIHRHLTIEDDLKVKLTEGVIQLPILTPGTPLDKESYTMDDWLDLMISDGSYRVDGKVHMATLEEPTKNLWFDKAVRIDMAEYYSFYFSLLMEGYGVNELVSSFFEPSVVSRWLKNMITDMPYPNVRSTYYPDEQEDTLEIITEMDKGMPLKDLTALAAYSIEGQEYALSEDFYRRLWDRDLTVFDYPERYMPSYYTPGKTYSFNYHRLLDIETIKYWCYLQSDRISPTTRMPSHTPSKYSSTTTNNLGQVIRFPTKQLKEFESMTLLSHDFRVRVTIRFEYRPPFKYLNISTISSHPDKNNLLSIIKDIKLRVKRSNINYWKMGRFDKTAVIDGTSFAIDTRFESLVMILETFLGFMLREYHCSIVRFG